jgi:hypothetical protein
MTDDITQIDRRSLLSSALLLVGATAAAGFSPEALAKAAARPKPYLDGETFTLLSAIADTIIPKTDTPGAVDARVPAKFDALLVNWAAPVRRFELTSAMSRIDRLARDKEARGFAELPPEKRKELLAAHDIAALKPVPRTDKLTGMRAMMAGPSVADPGYAKLKELLVVLYYYSEEALTTELVYEHVPGGWTPSVKATPETRATGGLGMF